MLGKNQAMEKSLSIRNISKHNSFFLTASTMVFSVENTLRMIDRLSSSAHSMAPIELLVIFRERTPVLTEAFSSALECNDYAKGMMTAQSDFLFF